jgi:uncharacterized metal-binding protein
MLQDMFDRCTENVRLALLIEPHLAHPRDGEARAVAAVGELAEELRCWVTDHARRSQRIVTRDGAAALCRVVAPA